MVETVSCLACSHKHHSVQKKWWHHRSPLFEQSLLSWAFMPSVCPSDFYRPVSHFISLFETYSASASVPAAFLQGGNVPAAFAWLCQIGRFLDVKCCFLQCSSACLLACTSHTHHNLNGSLLAVCVLLQLTVVGCSFVIFVSLEKQQHSNWFAFNKILTPEKPVSMVEITLTVCTARLYFSSCKKRKEHKIQYLKYKIKYISNIYIYIMTLTLVNSLTASDCRLGH